MLFRSDPPSSTRSPTAATTSPSTPLLYRDTMSTQRPSRGNSWGHSQTSARPTAARTGSSARNILHRLSEPGLSPGPAQTTGSGQRQIPGVLPTGAFSGLQGRCELLPAEKLSLGRQIRLSLHPPPAQGLRGCEPSAAGRRLQARPQQGRYCRLLWLCHPDPGVPVSICRPAGTGDAGQPAPGLWLPADAVSYRHRVSLRIGTAF